MNLVTVAGVVVTLVAAIFGVLLLVVPEFVEVFLVVDGKASDCAIGYLGVYEAGFDAESCLDAQTLVDSNLDSIPTQTGVDTTSFPLLFPKVTNFIRTIHPLYATSVQGLVDLGSPEAQATALVNSQFFPDSEGKTCKEYYEDLQPRQQALWDQTKENTLTDDVNTAIGGIGFGLLDAVLDQAFNSGLLDQTDAATQNFSPLLAGLFSGIDAVYAAANGQLSTSAIDLSVNCATALATAGGQAAGFAAAPVTSPGLNSPELAAAIGKLNVVMTSGLGGVGCCALAITDLESCIGGSVAVLSGSLCLPRGTGCGTDGLATELGTNLTDVCELAGADSPCKLADIADGAVGVSAGLTTAALLGAGGNVSDPNVLLAQSAELAWQAIDATLKYAPATTLAAYDALPLSTDLAGPGGFLTAIAGPYGICTNDFNSTTVPPRAACPYESQAKGIDKDLPCSIVKAIGGVFINPSYPVPLPSFLTQGQDGCSFVQFVAPDPETGKTLLNELATGLAGQGSDSLVQIGGLFALCTQAIDGLNYDSCWEFFNFYIIDATYSFGIGNKPYVEGGVNGGYLAAIKECEDDVLDADAITSAQTLGPAGVAIMGVAALLAIPAALTGKKPLIILAGVAAVIGVGVLLGALIVVYNAPIYASVGGDPAELADYTPVYISGNSLTYGYIAIAGGVVGAILVFASLKCGTGGGADLEAKGTAEVHTISL